MRTNVYMWLRKVGILYWTLRRRLRPLSWQGLPLFLLPMAADGASHVVSDLIGGVRGGFRSSNQSLAVLTGESFPVTFYSGDALGSINSRMRLISSILFGFGIVWFAYPRLHASFN